MKIELAVNGRLTLALLPEDALDTAILQEMAQRAQRGQQVTLAGPIEGKTTSYTVSVER